MHLTNSIRDEITIDVIKQTFLKETERLTKLEHDLGMKVYKKLYTAKEIEVVSKLTEWVKHQQTIRINLCGMDASFILENEVPVKKSADGWSRLGTIDDHEIKQAFLDLHADKQKMQEDIQKLRAQLKSVLYGVNTYKRLCETWPEGKKFYKKYAPNGDNSMLPAIKVKELNETLGLKSKV